MEIIIVTLAFIIGAAFGAFVVSRIMMFNISQNPRKIITLLEEIEKINEKGEEEIGTEEEPLDESGNISVEEHNGIVFIYDKFTKEFIAQGSNFDSAIAAAEKRFPGRFNTKIENLEHQST